MRSSANSPQLASADETPLDPRRHEAMIPLVLDATSEVFATMVFVELERGTPIVGSAQPVATVVGTVNFLGSVSGTVSFYSSDAAAREIVGAMLGIEPAEAGAEVADTVGEITNMIAGTFRGKLTQAGETLMITPPSVTVGTDFRAQHFNVAARVLCPFRMRGQDLFVELILQAS
jgi:chemotaxis protein CheX